MEKMQKSSFEDNNNHNEKKNVHFKGFSSLISIFVSRSLSIFRLHAHSLYYTSTFECLSNKLNELKQIKMFSVAVLYTIQSHIRHSYKLFWINRLCAMRILMLVQLLHIRSSFLFLFSSVGFISDSTSNRNIYIDFFFFFLNKPWNEWRLFFFLCV